MKKKILINGAGRGCLNLTKTAKKMGLYTIVTGMEGPCISIADKAYREVHPGHPEEVLKVARLENIDAIVTTCNDLGLESVGYCCDQMKLTGLSQASAQAASNKLLMKELLVKNGVRTARYFNVHNAEELIDKTVLLSYPIIIKATDLQGSRGICIVRDSSQLLSSFHDVMSLTHKDYCIVEEFIEGTEFGAQAFVFHGEVMFVLPHGDETIMCKTAVPVGHYMPYKMNEELANDVEVQSVNAINALGLDNCAVNIDFIERDNKAYIIELTGRGGANGLTDITGMYYGINYYEMIIQMALGNDPHIVFQKQSSLPFASKSVMIKSNKSGIVKSISIPTFPNSEINLFIKEGDEIRAFNNCNDAIGEIFVKGNNLSKCEIVIEEITESLKIEIQ